MLATYCGLPLTLVRHHYMTCDGETWVTGVSHSHGVPQNRTPTYAFSDLLKTTSGAQCPPQELAISFMYAAP